MAGDGRASFTEQLAVLRDQAGLSLADVATAAHVARGYVHHIERGRRWPTQRVAKALDNAVDAGGALLAAGEVADALPRAVSVPAEQASPHRHPDRRPERRAPRPDNQPPEEQPKQERRRSGQHLGRIHHLDMRAPPHGGEHQHCEHISSSGERYGRWTLSSSVRSRLRFSSSSA